MAEHPFPGPGLDVDVPTLRAALDAGVAVTIVDVREPYEWEAGRIEGAVHIPLAEVGHRAAELPRDRPVVFQCRVGGRSAMVADAFRRAGLDAWSLQGGLLDWVATGAPVVPDGGSVADH
ncbi:MAG: rhodanese-like domain-containing protein [Solirubrobacteraceae bacterium]|nr:rhodanese-like domain-containing protein [Solirubrobacteraceae bacterium]